MVHKLLHPVAREVAGTAPVVARALLASPAPEPQGRGPVMLIPGLLTGDRFMSPIAATLRRAGYTPQSAAMWCNVDCSERAVRHLARRLVDIADTAGEPVALVGHSRGGLFARVLAVRNQQHVRTIVTLGSPLCDQLALTAPLELVLRGLATAGSLGIPRLLRHRCRHGACCARFRHDLAAPFPSSVGFTSVLAPGDGVVRPAACRDPYATPVAVRTSHAAMTLDHAVHRAVLHALAGATAAAGRADGCVARAA